MHMSCRGVLILGAAGAALAGGLPTGSARPAEAETADGTDASTRTERLYRSGEDADHPVDWDFLCTSGRRSGSWDSIPVPSNWEFHGYGTYNYGWNLVPEEKGHYRHTFTPPARWRDRRVFLVFEGSMTDTEAWINGEPAGPVHRGGFYRFRHEVTGKLRPGQDNLLEVTVSKDSADDSVNRAERLGNYWNFGGINTDHYETYDSTRRILQEQGDIFMPTEFLHGLYDGAAGAGLDDYWKLMGHERLSAGGFLWSLIDERIVRDDLGGTVDVAGNAAPDGILGPFREKEASFRDTMVRVGRSYEQASLSTPTPTGRKQRPHGSLWCAPSAPGSRQ
ncbi:sugar-binding domain-containing protein [Streptomyces bobili]|uniref:sugar-binding domain-containing protein n=1 Tax=Streptomyces bobili TaxID=67280 RepID=UPI0036FADB47